MTSLGKITSYASFSKARMMTDYNPSSPEQFAVDIKWAKEKYVDLMFTLFLNIRLVEAGRCAKFIEEMNEKEYRSYINLITHLLEDSSPKAK